MLVEHDHADMHHQHTGNLKEYVMHQLLSLNALVPQTSLGALEHVAQRWVDIDTWHYTHTAAVVTAGRDESGPNEARSG